MIVLQITEIKTRWITWGGGSQIPTLVSSQDNFILPNGMKTSDVPLFIPNPVSNIPISPSTISLPNYFTVNRS